MMGLYMYPILRDGTVVHVLKVVQSPQRDSHACTTIGTSQQEHVKKHLDHQMPQGVVPNCYSVLNKEIHSKDSPVKITCSVFGKRNF